MPRSLLGSAIMNPIVTEACQEASPAPAPAPSAVAASGYMEIHGDASDWRLAIVDETLRIQKKQQSNGYWNTHFTFS